MSDRGVFAVDRGIWDHPSFDDEPFTQREAWQWLISEAAFKDRKKRVGSAVVSLDRGQVAASLRFMADKWQWNEPRVRRFLNRLKSDAMVTAETTQGITVLTICNYNKYQRVALPRDAANDAPSDAGATQERRKEESTKSTEVVTDDAASRAGAVVTPEAIALTEKLIVAAGHSLDFWPPGWIGAPMRVQTMLTRGWHPEIILVAVKTMAARKTGPPANSFKFFENGIAEEVARQAAPLPNVEVREAQTLQVNHAPNRGSGNVVEAFRRLREQVRSGNGDETGGGPVLSLPNG